MLCDGCTSEIDFLQSESFHFIGRTGETETNAGETQTEITS